MKTLTVVLSLPSRETWPYGYIVHFIFISFIPLSTILFVLLSRSKLYHTCKYIVLYHNKSLIRWMSIFYAHLSVIAMFVLITCKCICTCKYLCNIFHSDPLKWSFSYIYQNLKRPCSERQAHYSFRLSSSIDKITEMLSRWRSLLW